MQKTVRVTLFGGPAGLSMEYDLPSPPGARLPIAIQWECNADGENQIAIFLQGDPFGYYYSHPRKRLKEQKNSRKR